MGTTARVPARIDTPRIYPRGKKRILWCAFRGERWTTGTADRREAERKVRQKYDPRHAAAAARTIEDAVKLLYDALDRRGRSEATKQNARDKLGHFVRLWRGISLADIDYSTVTTYVKARMHPDDEELRPAARLTVSHELGYLRQAWKLARAHGWVPRAWDELMPERFDRGYKPRTRWLTPKELYAVLGSLPPEKAAWVAWVVATGSDVGDVGRARKGDLDWKRGLVRVRGTKTAFRDRLVVVSDVTRPLLELARRYGPPFEPWPWVNGELRKLAVRLDIPHFCPKDLRRTHGYWLRNAGVSPHLIGPDMGHADTAMADRVYAVGEVSDRARQIRAAVGTNRKNVRTKVPDVPDFGALHALPARRSRGK